MAKAEQIRPTHQIRRRKPDIATKGASRGARNSTNSSLNGRRDGEGKTDQLGKHRSKPKTACARIIRQLADVRRELASSRCEYRNALYERIAEVCRLGLTLKKDESLWAEFCQHGCWKKMERNRPTEAVRDQAVRYALKLVYRTGQHQKNASLYWRAVGPLLEEGHRPSELPDLIRSASFETEHGKLYGFKALAKRHASQQSSQGAGPDEVNREPRSAAPRRSTSGSSKAEDVAEPVHKEGRDERADHAKSTEGEIKMRCDMRLISEEAKKLLTLPLGRSASLFVRLEEVGQKSTFRVLKVHLSL